MTAVDDSAGAGTGRRWTGDELRALPPGAYVGYGAGIVARKRDDGDWTVFEDDRPGLRVSSLVPDRVTGVVQGGSRTGELARRLAGRLPAKPPLGVIPRRIHDSRRLADLDRALVEYSAAGLPPDPEWGRERDDLLAAPGQRGLTVASYARARQAGKVAEATEVAADAIDRLVARAVALDCGVLLVRGDRSLLGYVDARIPAGQLLEHPDPLPEGGVEALLASLYPPAGPRAAVSGV